MDYILLIQNKLGERKLKRKTQRVLKYVFLQVLIYKVKKRTLCTALFYYLKRKNMKSHKPSVLSTFCYSFSYFRYFFLIFHARDISKMTDLEKTSSDHILLKIHLW